MGFKALGAVLLPERGRRVYPICPSQEAALGMDVLIWVSHARKSLEQASRQKGTGSDGGIHTSTQGGKVKPYLELPGWLKTRKKFSLNSEITWKWRNKTSGIWPGNAFSKEKLPQRVKT